MVAESQPMKKPAKINDSSFRLGLPFRFHLARNTSPQTKYIATLYTAHDLYDLLMVQLYSCLEWKNLVCQQMNPVAKAGYFGGLYDKAPT
jgi:hypothetical protein